MSGGVETLRAVCEAPDPASAVAGLADEELEQLDEVLDALPATGIPGVVAGQVTWEMARRWRVERIAARERIKAWTGR